MKKLKRAYKIEINPTAEQKSKIHQTIGVSRFWLFDQVRETQWNS